jgi:hypothetical protein
MLSLPRATTRISTQGGTAPVSTDLIAVIAPVADNAAIAPWLASSVQSISDAHDHGDHVDYSAQHMDETGLPVLMVPCAIATAGFIKRQESVHTGTAKVSAAVGADGALKKRKVIFRVVSGGTVGTDSILLEVSLDNGTSYQPVRLGTATSYAIPRLGVTVTAVSGGTLVDDETILEFETVGPVADATGISAAKDRLAAQQKQVLDWLYIPEVTTSTVAAALASAASSYETTTERYVSVTFQARDPRVLESSRQRAAKTGSATVTFAEVGATGDTITRASGSFVTDGFEVGDWITVTGSVSNNVSGKITAVTATVLTLDTVDLAAEATVSGVTIKTEPSFVFASAGETLTRNRGSWITEGFAVGDTVTFAGTASNDGTHIITALSATVMTCTASTFVDETVGSCTASVTLTETDAQWQANIDTIFAAVDNAPRVHPCASYYPKLNALDGFEPELPIAWAYAVRAFEHDVHITTWHKERGPLRGWKLGSGHDERVNQGLVQSRFTTGRTYANGPNGLFIACAITRATDGSKLAYAHDVRVANVAQTACQAAQENFIGATLVLLPPNDDNERFATPKSLKAFEAKVNAELSRNLLADLNGEGPRASAVKWTAATDDDLGQPGATLNGVLTLDRNGTVHNIATKMEVR